MLTLNSVRKPVALGSEPWYSRPMVLSLSSSTDTTWILIRTWRGLATWMKLRMLVENARARESARRRSRSSPTSPSRMMVGWKVGRLFCTGWAVCEDADWEVAFCWVVAFCVVGAGIGEMLLSAAASDRKSLAASRTVTFTVGIPMRFSREFSIVIAAVDRCFGGGSRGTTLTV